MIREYVWIDDMPIAVIEKSSGTAVTYYIHTGHLNEPQVMTDASKAKVWDAYVTPFGKAKVFTTATANVDNRLPGQWYEAEAPGAGLNQNGYRDYDPSLGRYIEADPPGLGGGQNPYAYVNGQVYDLKDPTGRFWQVLIPAAGGAAIGGGTNLAWQLARNGGNWNCVNWKDVGVAAVAGGITGAFAPYASFCEAIALSGFVNVGQYGVTQTLDGNAITGKGVAFAGLIGAFGGALGASITPYGNFNPVSPYLDQAVVRTMGSQLLLLNSVVPSGIRNVLGGFVSNPPDPGT